MKLELQNESDAPQTADVGAGWTSTCSCYTCTCTCCWS